MISIALPKGRLGEKTYAMMAAAGYDCPAILEKNRKLTFENPDKGIRYFWVKPGDVWIYVERGTADVGICGKDTLMEHEPDLYELLDLGIGSCKMCVCGPSDSDQDRERTIRVATKFPHIAQRYYDRIGTSADIIQLNGSVEIAPVLQLSDVIVDIVESGRTLKANHLKVLNEIAEISARLICNKVSYQFRHQELMKLCQDMERVMQEHIQPKEVRLEH